MLCALGTVFIIPRRRRGNWARMLTSVRLKELQFRSGKSARNCCYFGGPSRRFDGVRARLREMKRIPSREGLRAISISLVVIGHWAELRYHSHVAAAFANLGGRIFFIISGYLIPTLLLKEYGRTSTLGLREFYTRRAYRILRLWPRLFAYGRHHQPGYFVWLAVGLARASYCLVEQPLLRVRERKAVARKVDGALAAAAWSPESRNIGGMERPRGLEPDHSGTFTRR
jgi:heme exporter protein D